MKHMMTGRQRGLFKPLIQSSSVQAAMMTLKPGETSSNSVENEHPAAEQWLYVVSGSGQARVGNRSIKLKTGSLLLIERRERHRIRGVGGEPLVTLNFYAPPAYQTDGEVRPAATSTRSHAR